ncbi:hypothetical protein A8B75_13620 [Sphingomonadales bacterium EhC05]|nr:hypothetical protein A8B75_13620 [Sphingomonadales bacterium EhC05]
MRIALYLSLLVAAILYALFRGGTPERIHAGILVGASISDTVVHMFTPAEYMVMDPGHAIIDSAAWVGFFAVALRANRFWPLWVVSLQTIAVVGHIAKLLDVSIAPLAYAIMQAASSYPLLIALMIGTYCHQKRLKANGIDPPWRSF